MYQKTIYICICWYIKICRFLVKKCWCQQNARAMSGNSYIFWVFFRYGITVPSFIIVRYVWQILEKEPFCPTILEPWKGQSWTELKDKIGITITKAFQEVLDTSERKRNKIWVDKVSEFYNRLENHGLRLITCIWWRK